MRLRESARAVVSRSSAEILGGRYRLDGLLGSGGAADVHRGFDLRLRRPVAVKVFRTDSGSGLEDSLHGEAVILARLHHPGLVTAYDAGHHDGRAFLVMQLVEGRTLRSLLADGPLSPGATAALGRDLARSLAHAHEAGIVHRDVKPSNILVDAAHRPYLTDFGISRLLDATVRTATGALVGTAAYLSPEQVLGRPVGRPADIYALGLVLLECLTGRLEYGGGPIEAAIARLHRQPVLPDFLPEQLAGLLRAMTALDERTRPRAHDCAGALAKGADALRREESDLSLRGPGPSVRPTGPVARHETSQTSDRTHRGPLSPGGRTAPRTGSVRARTLVVGASVSLAAVMATALAVTDGSAPPGNDRNATRASSAPAVTTDSPDGTDRTETTPSPAAPPMGGDAPARTLSGDPAGQSGRPASHGPDRPPAIAAATTAPAAPSETAEPATATLDGPTTKLAHEPPGLSRKAEKVANRVRQQKEAGKTARER